MKSLPTNKIFHVGLCININISHVSPSDADSDNDNSRFRFLDETSEFAEAVGFINSLSNINLDGIHIHRTAHNKSIRFYQYSIIFACKTFQECNLSLNYLDVSGDYYGIFPNKPTY